MIQLSVDTLAVISLGFALISAFQQVSSSSFSLAAFNSCKMCLVQPLSEIKFLSIINLIIQDEKAACNEGSLLGTWIGEDAIPCTPVVVKGRARTKLSCTR